MAANEGANTVSVLLGKGDGTFVAQPLVALSFEALSRSPLEAAGRSVVRFADWAGDAGPM